MITSKNVLKLEIRNKIFNHISANPGLHFNEISRTLDVPKSTLNYHLKYLTKKNILSEKTVGKYKRYYIYKKNGSIEKKLLHYLRQEIPGKILVILFAKIAQSCTDISKELDIHPNTVAYHLSKLLKDDVIEIAPYRKGIIYNLGKYTKMILRNTEGNPKFYKIKNADELFYVFIKNKHVFKKDEFTYEILDYHEKIFLDFFGSSPTVKDKDNLCVTDPIVERVFEIFPHPYHA